MIVAPCFQNSKHFQTKFKYQPNSRKGKHFSFLGHPFLPFPFSSQPSPIALPLLFPLPAAHPARPAYDQAKDQESATWPFFLLSSSLPRGSPRCHCAEPSPPPPFRSRFWTSVPSRPGYHRLTLAVSDPASLRASCHHRWSPSTMAVARCPSL